MGKPDLKNIMKNQMRSVAINAINNNCDGNVPNPTFKGNGIDTLTLPLVQIEPFRDKNGDLQPFEIHEEDVQALVDSIKENGLMNPITVRKKGNKYEILSGHCRYEACKRLKKPTVACIIKEANDDDALEEVIESNVHRMHLYPSELAKIYKYYVNKYKEENSKKYAVDKLKVMFKISKSSIYRYMYLLDFTKEFVKLFDIKLIDISLIEEFKKFSEYQQQLVLSYLKDINNGADLLNMKVGITTSTAKRMKAIIDENADISYDNFKELLMNNEEKKPALNKKYKSYNKKYNVNLSENEWDNIITEFLNEKFHYTEDSEEN